MAPPEILTKAVEPWANLYSHSKGLETVIMFLHIGGLLLAGGFAVAADRGTLRALARPAGERAGHMADLASIHRWVIGGLVIVALSGLLQFASDLETFWGSWIFWSKMAMVAILLVNGLVMQRAEQAVAREGGDASPGWTRLKRAAVVSLVLWFATTLAGVALMNLA